MSYGILYLSFGDTYVDCTVAALQSKIKNAPRTPAKVLTNRKADLNSKLCKDNGIQVEYVEAPASSCKGYKTQAYKYSPWEYTLMLDADAWINKELSDQFKLLEIAPMALVHAYFHPSIGAAHHIGPQDRALTVKALHGCTAAPHYASGLVFFRRDDTGVRKLFDTWHAEWNVLKQKDQGALMRAIVRTQVFPLVLWRDYWLTARQGKGFISHRFDQTLPSMPRKDKAAPMRLACIP